MEFILFFLITVLSLLLVSAAVYWLCGISGETSESAQSTVKDCHDKLAHILAETDIQTLEQKFKGWEEATWSRSDFDGCFEKACTEMASRGHPKFILILAQRLARRAPARNTEVFNHALKAAEQGVDEAMHFVSQLYKAGIGVLKNQEDSLNWLLKAADAGFIYAQKDLGIAYITGDGAAVDPVEGIAWLYVVEFKGLKEIGPIIREAERKLERRFLVAAQNRAKAILEAIKQSRPTGVPTAVDSSTPQTSQTKPSGKPKGSGSGSIVSRSGHIVTASHVIKGMTYLEVVTPKGTFAARVVSNDPANDLTLLKIEQETEATLPVLHSRNVRLGSKVSTIGFPNLGIQGHSPKVTEGVISSDHGVQNDVRMWQISVPIQPGNSGGPLLDEAGCLVGVVVASLSLEAIKITGAVPQNVNYAVKSAYLEPM